jgi:hypothetical protein
MVSICITYFNIKEFRIFQAGRLEVFLMILTLNIEYFLEDHCGV